MFHILLSTQQVVEDKDNKADLIEAFVGQGKIVNSEFLNGLDIIHAKKTNMLYSYPDRKKADDLFLVNEYKTIL